MVCDLNQKINVLWSFIKSHRKKKILVFMQVSEIVFLDQLFSKPPSSTFSSHLKRDTTMIT